MADGHGAVADLGGADGRLAGADALHEVADVAVGGVETNGIAGQRVL